MSLTDFVTGNGTGAAATGATELASGGRLPTRLAIAMAEASVRHCQWKGAWKFERWSEGEGDIDLLVDRTARSRFEAVLTSLGFRMASADPRFALPGVSSWLALDGDTDRLIHVHVYHQLYVGQPWSTHLRLPIERAVLESAMPGAWFSMPAVEFELVMLVLHGTLRHGVSDLTRDGDAEWLPALRSRVEHLGGEADPYVVADILSEHLPELGAACFDRCQAALGQECSPWRRLAVRRELTWRLRAYARRPSALALVARAGRALPSIAGKRALPHGRKRLATGGAVIALAGTDGAGKSTCARDLHQWLGAELRVRHAHLGLPPRGIGSLLAGGVLRGARRIDAWRGRSTPSPLTAYCELLRAFATARDRRALYRRVWRFASDGGIAICERYPVPEEHALVGPSSAQGVATAARGRVASLLRRREAAHYARMREPDVLVVLRVSPAIAVGRKLDEPPAYVHDRACRVANVVWRSMAVMVDADRPLAEVGRDVRRRVWEAL
ncbi:MAG TPA: hypothetical protein VF178_00280 [Gemmatimonadaceae bacterium]